MRDSALRSGQVGVDELLRLSKCLPGRRDAQRARRVLELCDALAASVLESVLRVRMVLAGMSGFRTQYTLLGRDGRHVLRADFCFVSKRLIVEVDGVRWHQDVLRDQRVDNAVAALGWRVLRYGCAEVVLNPQNVVAEIDEALRSAAFGVQLPSGIAAAAA